jgi:hypothetical protein
MNNDAQTDLDEGVKAFLDSLAPPIDFRGDWQAVLLDANRRRFPTDTIFRAPRRLTVVLLAAIIGLIAVVSALAVANGWWFLAHEGPTPKSPPAKVTSVAASDGSVWTLTTYSSERDGVCVIMTPEDETSGSAEGCGAGIRGETNLPQGTQLHAIAYVQTRATKSSNFIFGPSAPDVESVQLTLINGAIVRTKTFASPPDLKEQVRFFVVEIPQKTPAQMISAFNGAGRLVEKVPVQARRPS